MVYDDLSPAETALATQGSEIKTKTHKIIIPSAQEELEGVHKERQGGEGRRGEERKRERARGGEGRGGEERRGKRD